MKKRRVLWTDENGVVDLTGEVHRRVTTKKKKRKMKKKKRTTKSVFSVRRSGTD